MKKNTAEAKKRIASIMLGEAKEDAATRATTIKKLVDNRITELQRIIAKMKKFADEKHKRAVATNAWNGVGDLGRVSESLEQMIEAGEWVDY